VLIANLREANSDHAVCVSLLLPSEAKRLAEEENAKDMSGLKTHSKRQPRYEVE
jgi:hypothetical protein